MDNTAINPPEAETDPTGSVRIVNNLIAILHAFVDSKTFSDLLTRMGFEGRDRQRLSCEGFDHMGVLCGAFMTAQS